jgi:prepilin-type N-terminal cleavage/methylation domain-containing protein
MRTAFYQSILKVNNKQGFSLVELSIVLVILGLLTGGILTGQSLIKAAELRSITVDTQNFATAVNTFKGKYFALPGDLTNATAFWGDNSSECADGTITDGTPGTCNGNGNGIIEEDASGATSPGEAFMIWNQLAYANLIEGEYSGLSGTSDDGVEPDENVPLSSYSPGVYQIISRNHASDSSESGYSANYSYDHRHSVMLGIKESGDWGGTPFLSTEESWNIDKKIDDGIPAQGIIRAGYWNNLCSAANDGTHANNDFDARYRTEDDSIQCALIFHIIK